MQERLGYVPISKLEHVPDIDVFIVHGTYIAYPMAKMLAFIFSTSNIKNNYAFEIIHINILGSNNVITKKRYKYFPNIVYDFNKGAWAYLLQCMSKVFDVMLKF